MREFIPFSFWTTTRFGEMPSPWARPLSCSKIVLEQEGEAKKLHPDKPGGSAAQMEELKYAYDYLQWRNQEWILEGIRKSIQFVVPDVLSQFSRVRGRTDDPVRYALAFQTEVLKRCTHGMLPTLADHDKLTEPHALYVRRNSDLHYGAMLQRSTGTTAQTVWPGFF